MKKLYRISGLLLGFLVPCLSLLSQPNITRVEYYLDTDPGYGNAIAVTISAGTNLADQVIGLDPTTLDAGVHVLGIRAQDANGAWSHDNKWILFKPYSSLSGPGSTPSIARVEYYLDTDPGYGNAIAVSISAGTNLADQVISLDPGSLTTGVHVLGIRAQDANGAWSHDSKWLLVRPYAELASPPATPAITRVEYYVDNDPGYGNGTAISTGVSTSLSDIVLSLDVAPLSQGNHTVAIRAQDANGAWSMDNIWAFTRAASLPLHFVAVWAKQEAANIMVNWETTNEEQTASFVIEKSDDGKQFVQVGAVPASNSSGNHQYNFVDEDGALTQQPRIYYRIKQVDKDNHYTYSEILMLPLRKTANGPMLYPNPVINSMQLLWKAAAATSLQWKIYDARGSMQLTGRFALQPGTNLLPFNLSNLAKGMYRLQVKAGSTEQTFSFIKQ